MLAGHDTDNGISDNAVDERGVVLDNACGQIMDG